MQIRNSRLVKLSNEFVKMLERLLVEILYSINIKHTVFRSTVDQWRADYFRVHPLKVAVDPQPLVVVDFQLVH